MNLHFLHADPDFTVLFERFVEAKNTYEELLDEHHTGQREPDEATWALHKDQVIEIQLEIKAVLSRFATWRLGRGKLRDVIRTSRLFFRYQHQVSEKGGTLEQCFARFALYHQNFCAALTALRNLYSDADI